MNLKGPKTKESSYSSGLPLMKSSSINVKLANNPPTISHPIKIESRQLPQMKMDISKMTANANHQSINLLTSEMKPISVKHVLLENVMNPAAAHKGTRVLVRDKPLLLARP